MTAFGIATFVSFCIVILNKVCLDSVSSPFPFPLTFTWFQFIVAGTLMMLVQVANDRLRLEWFPKADVVSATSFGATSVAVMYCAMVTSERLCLRSIQLSFFPVIQALHVCFAVSFAYFCFREVPNAKAMIAAIGVLIGCYVLLLGAYFGEFSLDGLLWGTISSGFVALYPHLLQNNVSFSIMLLAPVVLLSNEWPGALDALINLDFKIGLLLSSGGIAGFGCCFLSMPYFKSELSTILSNVVMASGAIIFGIFYFGDLVTASGSAGTAICFVGIVLYYFSRDKKDDQGDYSNISLGSTSETKKSSNFATACVFITIATLIALPEMLTIYRGQFADTAPKLSIITSCYSVNNLQKIGHSINWNLTREWILAYDATSISLERIKTATQPNHHCVIYLPVKLNYANKEELLEGEMRSHALQVAKGDWIYFLDEDNLMHPDFWPFLKQVISNGTNNIFFSFDQEEMYSNYPSLPAFSNITRRAPWKSTTDIDPNHANLSKQIMEEEVDKAMFLVPRMLMLPLATKPQLDTVLFIRELAENSEHAYFHQVRSYREYFAPDLSVVAISYHNGLNEEAFGFSVNMLVSSLAILSTRYKIKLEIIFTGANPSLLGILDSNPVLRELDQRIDIYTIPPGMNEFAAKNIGVRRAKGRVVIVSSPDLIFSPGLMDFVSKNYVEQGNYYVAVRAEVSAEGKHLTSVKGFDRLISRCRNTMHEAAYPPKSIDDLKSLRVAYQYHLSKMEKFIDYHEPFFDTAADFVMMHRDDWRLVRGYAEKEGLNGRLDAILLKLAALSGIQQRILALHRCVFHIAHAKVGDLEEVNVENPADLRNNLHWGLENTKLPHASVPH